jgi:hypothetical protein
MEVDIENIPDLKFFEMYIGKIEFDHKSME